MKFTRKEKSLLGRFWKTGVFKSHSFFCSSDVLRNLERLGIIIKTGSFEYVINRKKFLEMQDNEDISIQTNIRKYLNSSKT